MSHIAIVVEVTAGALIDRVCEEAVALANLTGVKVQFKFNGVIVIAGPGHNPARLAEYWRLALESERPVKIAVDRGEIK